MQISLKCELVYHLKYSFFQARDILKTVLKSDNNFELKNEKIFYFKEIFFSQKLTFCTPDQPRSYNFPTFRFLKCELVIT